MRNKIKIPFTRFSTIPLVSFTLTNGKKCTAIIDTGSDVTIFDREFVKKNKDDFSIVSDVLFNVSGIHSVNKHRSVEIKTKIAFTSNLNIEVSCTGLILPLDTVQKEIEYVDMLLGSDFLSQHNMTIDFENNLLSFEYDISSQ